MKSLKKLSLFVLTLGLVAGSGSLVAHADDAMMKNDNTMSMQNDTAKMASGSGMVKNAPMAKKDGMTKQPDAMAKDGPDKMAPDAGAMNSK